MRALCLLLLGCILGACTWFEGLEAAGPPERREASDASTEDGGRHVESPTPTWPPARDAGPKGNAPTEPHEDPVIAPTTDDEPEPEPEPSHMPDGSVPPPPLGAPRVFDHSWHPIEQRFAVTRDPALANTAQRAWLVVQGDAARPRRLVAHQLETAHDAWRDTGIDRVGSNPQAIAFTEGDVHHQRVLFTREGLLGVLDVDIEDVPDAGEAENTLTLVQAPSGYALTNQLGAVAFGEGGARRIVALASATRGGEAGHYCILELTLDSVGVHAQCSNAPSLAEASDVAGVVLGASVQLFFVGLDHGLRGVSRTTDGRYEERPIATPYNRPLTRSLAAVASVVDEVIELFAITSDGLVWTARQDPPFAADPAWQALPRLAFDVSAKTEAWALAAGVSDSRGVSEDDYRTSVAVLGADGAVYQMSTEPNEARPWPSQWDAVLPPARGEEPLAIGAMTQYGWLGYELPSALCVVGMHATTTLQEALSAVVRLRWRDHVRLEPQAVIAESEHAFAEVSVASGAAGTLAALVTRGPSAPLQTMLAASLDGASSWMSVPLAPLPPDDDIGIAASVMNPNAAYGGGRLHLVTLEWDLPTDCSNAASHSQRIVYRRGSDAIEIASLDDTSDPGVFVVAEGGRYSDPVLAITEGQRGPTVHVLFNDDLTGVVRYWRLEPDMTEAPTIALDVNMLDRGRLQLATGHGQALYAASMRGSLVRVCSLSTPLSATACALVQPPSEPVRPSVQEIAFGAAEESAQGACMPIEGQHFRCLRDGTPFSMAASQSHPNKLYFAFTDVDSADAPEGPLSIYVTESSGGTSFGAWSEPVRIHARPAGDRRSYFDPELTIDGNDDIVVTYAALASAQPDTQATVYLGYLESSGSYAQIALGHWDASRLPFDCLEQRWALGDSRRADIVGSRALHVLRSDDGPRTQHRSRWLSRFALP